MPLFEDDKTGILYELPTIGKDWLCPECGSYLDGKDMESIVVWGRSDKWVTMPCLCEEEVEYYVQRIHAQSLLLQKDLNKRLNNRDNFLRRNIKHIMHDRDIEIIEGRLGTLSAMERGVLNQLCNSLNVVAIIRREEMSCER